MIHFALTLHPFYTSTNVVSHHPQINKRKAVLIAAVIYYFYYGSGSVLLLLTLDFIPAEPAGTFFLLIVLLSIITSIWHFLVP